MVPGTCTLRRFPSVKQKENFSSISPRYISDFATLRRTGSINQSIYMIYIEGTKHLLHALHNAALW